MSDIIELHQRDAVHNFRVGQPIHLTWTDGGLRVATRWERLLQRLRRAWRSATWWRQSRYRVSAVDVAAGVITTERLSWSWRRWRWEAQ